MQKAANGILINVFSSSGLYSHRSGTNFNSTCFKCRAESMGTIPSIPLKAAYYQTESVEIGRAYLRAMYDTFFVAMLVASWENRFLVSFRAFIESAEPRVGIHEENTVYSLPPELPERGTWYPIIERSHITWSYIVLVKRMKARHILWEVRKVQKKPIEKKY